LEVASEFFVFLANFHAESPGPAWKKGVDLEVWVRCSTPVSKKAKLLKWLQPKVKQDYIF
jgi:hypothetical protein